MPDQVRHVARKNFLVIGEKIRSIPGRIYLRYLFLMIPGVVILILFLMIVEHWVTMPSWLFWTVISLWLAKEVVIFPFVWHAHDPNRPGISRTMIGAHGIVKERLDPVGYIQVAGELWKAEHLDTAQPIEKGERVRVLKMEGLRLFVSTE
jgi:membrane-bound ClpP family serine protease